MQLFLYCTLQPWSLLCTNIGGRLSRIRLWKWSSASVRRGSIGQESRGPAEESEWIVLGKEPRLHFEDPTMLLLSEGDDESRIDGFDSPQNFDEDVKGMCRAKVGDLKKQRARSGSCRQLGSQSRLCVGEMYVCVMHVSKWRYSKSAGRHCW